MIVTRTKEIRDLEAELARVNAEVAMAKEELTREQTLCERQENER